jgi:hypothetical protein
VGLAPPLPVASGLWWGKPHPTTTPCPAKGNSPKQLAELDYRFCSSKLIRDPKAPQRLIMRNKANWPRSLKLEVGSLKRPLQTSRLTPPTWDEPPEGGTPNGAQAQGPPCKQSQFRKGFQVGSGKWQGNRGQRGLRRVCPLREETPCGVTTNTAVPYQTKPIRRASSDRASPSVKPGGRRAKRSQFPPGPGGCAKQSQLEGPAAGRGASGNKQSQLA